MKTESPDQAKFTDKQLLSLFIQANNEEAFSELVARHGPLVMRVCKQTLVRQQDAEDVFQAVFLVLARKSRSVAWQNSIANWLYGVAWRISRNAKRRMAQRNAKIAEHHGDMTEFSDTNEPLATDIDAAEQLLYPALYQLAAKYRAPIILCHLEGKSRSQAAEELGVTESIIKGRLERGLESLRKTLAKNGPQTMSVLTAGLLANKIAHSAIPDQMSASLVQASAEFATSAASASVSSSTLAIAKAECLQMLLTFQLKLATIILGLICAGACVLMLTLAPASVDNWEQLGASQRDKLTQNNLKAIITAVHQYVDDHNGMLPPAAIPNPNLPPEKRLSGFVLLLPYLNAKPIFDQIDQSKGWDDPANAKAARSIVAEFLSPDEDTMVDSNGRAISHFAFVRGSMGRDNGMFPLVEQAQLGLPDISDGTSVTLAVGQIHCDFGPWIAAGPSTARFIDPPNDHATTPGFGSKHAGAAYFANGDGAVYLWDLSAENPTTIHAIAGRNDSVIFDRRTKFARYATAAEWAKAKHSKGSTP